MFYAHFVLAKKGPLAKIWLAAHWDKKLTKAHVFETNIESSVEGILQPKVKMALRTSGHLLLGIVRIYSRKAKYLLADCNEAFIKIKMAFRPGVVDLPEDNRAASVAAITLPEVFHDFDAAMPNITIDMDAQVTLNQSRVEDITMKEDYGTFSLITDDAFEMGFDADVEKDGANVDDGFDHSSFLLTDEQPKEISGDGEASSSNKPSTSLDAPLKDDGFGGTVGEGLLDSETGGLFEPSGLFDDAPLDNVSLDNNATISQDEKKEDQEKALQEEQNNESDDDMYDMGPASMGAPSPPSSPELRLNTGLDGPESGVDLSRCEAASSLDFVDTQLPANPSEAVPDLENINTPNNVPQIQPPPISSNSGLDQTTLINNEEETFALAPLDVNLSLNMERVGKIKRKRKLIVDEVKNISGEEMKSQLSDTTDIVSSLDLAPPTKRLMHWKETGGVEKLFSLPGQPILAQSLSKVYQRHLTTRSVDNEEFGIKEEDKIDLETDIEQPREEEPMNKKRRRDFEPCFPQDLSHVDPIHLDSTRSTYSSDHRISHPSLDVSNFIQNQHLLSSMSTPQLPNQHQLMTNVIMQHPPPAHMIHQIFQNDGNQISHISQMMHPLVEPGPSHHPITSTIHNVQSPIVSESYNQVMHHSVIETVPQHVLNDNIPSIPDHIQHHPVHKQMLNHPSLENHQTLNHQPIKTEPQFQKQLPQTGLNHLTCVDNNMIQPSMDNHSIVNAIDDEMTQPLLDDHYLQSHMESNLNSVPATSSSEMPLCDVAHSVEFNNQIPSNHENQMQHASVDNANLGNDSISNPSISNANISNTGISNESNVQPVMPLSDNLIENGNTELQSDIFNSLNNDEQRAQNAFNDNETNQNKSGEAPVPPSDDDDDDYGAPSSVGPALPEEQMADETYEQFEERILTKRTTHMLHTIEETLNTKKSVSFSELVRNNKRKQVAQKFYTFLVLKKQQAVELEQNSTYDEMVITKGPKFDAVYNAN